MIHGKKVSLRTVRAADVDRLFDFLCDLSTRGEFFPLSLLSESAFRKEFHETGFWSDSYSRLLVCDPDERIVGSIWFFRTAHYYDGFEIGYHLFDVANRGRGYATEALSLLVRFLFATRKINRLQLTTMLGNVGSQRVAEKAGFRKEGIARGAIFHQGRNHDLQMYSLLRADLDGATRRAP
jgi:[ribosomal protein S5]-alanine N-acetyltransferase